MAKRDEIVSYLDEVFSIVPFNDYSYNGLQFEGKSEVTHIAAGVDATNPFFKEAAKIKADFALVHHGLFWKGAEWVRLDRINQTIFRNLDKANLNLYAVHLPLDAHPKFGNNAVIAKELKAKVTAPFSKSRGGAIGVLAEFAKPITVAEFKNKIEKVIGPIHTHLDFGKKQIKTIGIVSGGGWGSVNEQEVYEGKVDAILTGEILHQGVANYRDRQIHLFSAGHYATEVFGARALGQHLAKKFGLKFSFIDLPTGL